MNFRETIDKLIRRNAHIITVGKKKRNLSNSETDLLMSFYNKDKDPVIFFDQFGKITYNNDAFLIVLKNDKNKKEITNVYDMFEINASLDYEDDLLTFNYENGFIKSFRVKFALAKFEKSYFFKMTLTDISDFVKRERAQTRKLNKVTTLLNAIEDMVFVTDHNLFIDYAIGKPLLTKSITSLVKENVYEVFPSTYCNELKDTLSKGGSSFLYNNSDGRNKISLETKISYGENTYTFLVKDASRLVSLSSGINYLNSYDSLTGLFKKEAFDNKIQEIANKSFLPLGIMKIKIMGIREYNEKESFEKGNQLISILSHKIRTLVTGFDITSRVSGDTFGILFPNTSKKFVAGFAKKITSSSVEIFQDLEPYELSIDVSYDIADAKTEDIEKKISETLL